MAGMEETGGILLNASWLGQRSKYAAGRYLVSNILPGLPTSSNEGSV